MLQACIWSSSCFANHLTVTKTIFTVTKQKHYMANMLFSIRNRRRTIKDLTNDTHYIYSKQEYKLIFRLDLVRCGKC